MNTRKIGLYILLAFAISWLSYLLMRIFEIEYGSITSLIIIAAMYMPGPAIAAFIVQKLIYKEPLKDIGWSFDAKDYKLYLNVAVLFAALMLLIFAVVAFFGNTGILPAFGKVDFSSTHFTDALNNTIQSKLPSGSKAPSLPSLPPIPLFFGLMLQGVVLGGIVNLPFMFGEEFGWRGLLEKEMRPWGFVKSSLFIGLVWGLWHAPIILMGHNYPSNPKFGVIMMCFMTMALAPLFSYVRLKTKSILGPCLLHGMINGSAAIFSLYIADLNEFYSTIAGWAGVIASLIVLGGIFIFDKNFWSTRNQFD